jgi:glycosyltransferase involved in cell wall biosynthesis
VSLARPFDRQEPACGDDLRSAVVLTPWFPNVPGERNGSFIYDSAAAIASKGVAVTVLACRPSIPVVPANWVPEWARGKIDTRRFAESLGGGGVVSVKYLAIPGGAFRKASNFSQRLRVKPALEALARKTRARLIHAQTEGMAPIAVEVARTLEVPAVVTIHGINTDPNYLHAKAQRAILVPALRDADRLVLVGQPLKDVFARYVGRSDHVRVVNNGVRLPNRIRRSQVLSATAMRLVSVSNLHEGKGIDLVLDALTLINRQGSREWTYTVIGDGAERGALIRKARTHGLSDRIKFLGALPHEAVLETLLDSDVFVLPSYREAFGIAYLEAMACGLPTIGVRGQGPEAFIEPGLSGFLVEPRSATAVADCLGGILARPEDARRIGERARSRAQDFGWDTHANHLMEIYREAVSARRR